MQGASFGRVDSRATRRTILLVEPDSELSGFLTERLWRHGRHMVLEASDVPQALQLLFLFSSEIDTLIIECSLPAADGLRFARDVHRMYGGMRVVMLCEKSDACRIEGAPFPVITKPLDVAQLLAVLGSDIQGA